MFDIKSIVEPETLEEALKMLENNRELMIISGGTDVLIKLHHGNLEGVDLISLKKIKELKFISLVEDETIEIGATTSFADIFRDENIKAYIPALGESSIYMGGPQIRNMATIGGNICNGAVSADSAPSLFAFNAKLKIRSSKGERIVPIVEFYKGPGKVYIDKDEILVSVLIEKENYKGTKGTYIKYANRKAMDIAMVGVCVVASVEKNKFKDLRISLGVAAPTPIRCIYAEEYGMGIDATDENIQEIAKLVLKSARARDSWRASKDYREHLVQELTERAIKKVVHECEGK
ncbi:MAG: xanthine dehydrogenase FAD-binding subunit XdhB [Clostridium sp.]|uniref:xanthine dehydrogenase FAD-binding subunit XdhB n=1 Tax=Clostridium sp. TaxID=1506 RepID=UPI003027E01F